MKEALERNIMQMLLYFPSIILNYKVDTI